MWFYYYSDTEPRRRRKMFLPPLHWVQWFDLRAAERRTEFCCTSVSFLHCGTRAWRLLYVCHQSEVWAAAGWERGCPGWEGQGRQGVGIPAGWGEGSGSNPGLGLTFQHLLGVQNKHRCSNSWPHSTRSIYTWFLHSQTLLCIKLQTIFRQFMKQQNSDYKGIMKQFNLQWNRPKKSNNYYLTLILMCSFLKSCLSFSPWAEGTERQRPGRHPRDPSMDLSVFEHKHTHWNDQLNADLLNTSDKKQK